MLLQEFKNLTGFSPSEDYFNDVIHPDYMGSGLDKVAWCKMLKRKGGIQTAYNAMAEELATAIERLVECMRDYKNKCDTCAELKEKITDLQEKKLHLQVENVELREEINNYKNQVARLNDREVFIDTLNKFCN